jgi:hypothetical protein
MSSAIQTNDNVTRRLVSTILMASTLLFKRADIDAKRLLSGPHANLAAALALTGHEAEAREALQHYLELPSSAQLRTIVAFRAYQARFRNGNSDPARFRKRRPVHRGIAQGGYAGRGGEDELSLSQTAAPSPAAAPLVGHPHADTPQMTYIWLKARKSLRSSPLGRVRKIDLGEMLLGFAGLGLAGYRRTGKSVSIAA